MAKMKVLTIVGTRPEIIRLSRLIPLLDQHTEHTLVHTGQNYDARLKDIFFDDLGLRSPDRHLELSSSSLAGAIGSLLPQIEAVLLDVQPDAVMILGDTNSALSAILCERMAIPVYHMEAGNRSFDANVPEELNRRLVDHIASFNLPYNEFSRRNLLAEGLHPRRVLKTGSPLPEVIAHYSDRISGSTILDDLQLQAAKYFVASFHRQENVDVSGRLKMILDALEAVSAKWELPVIVSTHPRTASRLNELGRGATNSIRLLPPLSFTDYCKLQANAACVMSDSGTISEESALLGFPSVTLRDSMERPESLESGGVILSGLSRETVVNAVEWAMTRKSPALPDGCEILDFSDRVLSHLLSTAHLHKKWSGLNH